MAAAEVKELKTQTMGNSETKENPAFLEYVYKLNEGNELTEALQLSLKNINEICGKQYTQRIFLWISSWGCTTVVSYVGLS